MKMSLISSRLDAVLCRKVVELVHEQYSEKMDTRTDELDQEAEVNRVLYLRSLAAQTTEDELRELFMQAGPLEKVVIPQSKPNTAFITFCHSVSVPYAKELFSDTQLHGRNLSINFRHGSTHDQQRNGDHNRNQGYNNSHASHNEYIPEYSAQPNTSSYHGNSRSHDRYNTQHYQDHRRYQNDYRNENRFQSREDLPLQGYRSSTENREYVPGYVNFDNPPTGFMGAAPINHPDHPVDLQSRRDRLMTQQHYAHQAQHNRNERHHNRRR